MLWWYGRETGGRGRSHAARPRRAASGGLPNNIREETIMVEKKAVPKRTSPSYYIGVVIMLAVMLLGPGVVPPWAEGITQGGVAVACVFVGAIIGILTTNDLILCALFSMGGLVVNGILGPAEVVSSFMGASYVWQIIVLYALCYVIIRDNTGEVIARFLLTRKFTQKFPMVMVMMLFFALGLAAAFMGVFGALIVGFALLDGIFAEAGIDPKGKLARLLCLGAFITMCIGPMTIGSMAALNLAAGQFFLAATGIQVVTLRFVVEAFAILIAFCVVFALALKVIFRCDTSALGKVDLARTLEGKSVRLTRRQWIPLVAFLIIALHSFTSAYWPEVPVLGALKHMDTVIFTSVVLAVLALVRVDGEQIFNPVEAFSKGVSWPIVMAVASMASIGGLLVADEYGVKAWLTQVLGGLFSNSNPVLFVVMTVLITLVITNIFSNTATLLVISSLVSALSAPLVEAGYDITILAVAISLSSMVAYLTYASSGQAAILLGRENMNNKFIWTYGIAAMVIYAVVVIAVSAVCLFV